MSEPSDKMAALEPAAISHLGASARAGTPGEYSIELSKAISAKRQADALERIATVLEWQREKAEFPWG